MTTYHRTLGLTVPITELLDPARWRERYAANIILGTGETLAESSVLAELHGCRPSGAPQTKGLQEDDDETVNEIVDDVIRWHLKVALSELEMRIGIPMGIVVCKSPPVDDGLTLGVHYDKVVPRLPFLRSEQMEFYRIDLPAGVISVERIRAYWYGQVIWEISAAAFNDAMIRLEHPGTSSLHIIPTQTTSLLLAGLGAGFYGPLHLLGGEEQALPDVWAVDYTLGPKSKYGAVGTIEAALAHWCYCKAALLLFSMAGQAISRGVTNASLSIDGLSKSIGLNGAQGLNAALEQRFKEAEEAIDWKDVRTYKRGLRVRPYA